MRGLLLRELSRAALALALVLMFSIPVGAVVLDRIVALVNNESITWLELYSAMEKELAPRLKGLGEEERREVLAKAEEGFLDSMVIRKLQLQEAARQDIYVSQDEVEFTIKNIRTKYGLGPEEFQKAVEESGADWSGYKENLRDQIVIQKLVDKAVRSTLDGGGGENTAEVGTKYSLQQIFLKGEGEEEVMEKVRKVYDALEAGEEFEILALRMSEGPNASSGGDLGIVEEFSLSEPMRQALQGVASGQVAPPVTSGLGVHIIKVVTRISGDGQDREAEFQQAYEKWLKNLRERARIELRLH